MAAELDDRGAAAGVSHPRGTLDYMAPEVLAAPAAAVTAAADAWSLGVMLYEMLSGGASAEYITVPEGEAVAEMPAGLDFDEAAALPFGAVCALVFLGEFGNFGSFYNLEPVGWVPLGIKNAQGLQNGRSVSSPLLI